MIFGCACAEAGGIPKDVKKSTSTSVKVSWSETSYGCSGYQISKSTSGLQEKCKVVKAVTGSGKKSATVTAKKGSPCYYRVRAYKVINGKKVYGPWSVYVKYTLK